MSRVKRAYEAGKVAALEKFAGPWTDAAKALGYSTAVGAGVGGVGAGLTTLLLGRNAGNRRRPQETFGDLGMRALRNTGSGAYYGGGFGAVASLPIVGIELADDLFRQSRRNAMQQRINAMPTPELERLRDAGRNESARRRAGMEHTARPSNAQDLSNFQVAPSPEGIGMPTTVPTDVMLGGRPVARGSQFPMAGTRGHAEEQTRMRETMDRMRDAGMDRVTPYPMPGTAPATTATNTPPLAPQEVQDLGARFRGLDIAPPSAGGAHPDDLAEALARFRALELD